MVKHAYLKVLPLFSVALLFCLNVAAVDTSRLQQMFYIPYTGKAIVIDGQLNDWRQAFQYSFSDTLQQPQTPAEYPFSWEYPENYAELLPKPKSRNTVEVMLCWDMNYLYLAFKVSDVHLFAEIDGSSENPDIFMNDGIELYIDTGNDSKDRMDINDYQFIVDIQNNSIVFRGDKRLSQLYEDKAVPKDFGQNILFKSAVSFLGIVKNTNTSASGYIAELAIPFAAIGVEPKTEKRFKMDLCVNDVDYFLHEVLHYNGKPIIAWSFNWIGLSNFGFPAYWQSVELSGSPGWFDRMAYKARQRWLLLLVIIFIVTLVIYSLFLIRLIKLGKLPAKDKLRDDAVLVIKGEQAVGQAFNENRQLLLKASNYIHVCGSLMPASEMVAREMGVSLRKLQRITKAEMNCTPTRFIYLVKLNQSANYLANNEGNVSEAAYEFGFTDPSYFSKLFKNHFGISPAEYRSQNRR
jgi:AraC-like DNA-binding protein